MRLNREKLLTLWNTEDLPACEGGMQLAQKFLFSCAEAVNRFGEEGPADRSPFYDFVIRKGARKRCLVSGQRKLLRYAPVGSGSLQVPLPTPFKSFPLFEQSIT